MGLKQTGTKKAWISVAEESLSVARMTVVSHFEGRLVVVVLLSRTSRTWTQHRFIYVHAEHTYVCSLNK